MTTVNRHPNHIGEIEVKWKKGDRVETHDDVFTMWETAILGLEIDMYKYGASWVFGPKGQEVFGRILSENHKRSYLGWTKKEATKAVISLVETKLLLKGYGY